MNEELGDPRAPNGRKTSALILALLFVAAIAGIIRLVAPPKETEYAGRPLSYWLMRYHELGQLTAGPRDPKAVECREAIRQIGTNALPTLLHMLRAKDSAWKSKLLLLLERHTPLPFRSGTAESENWKAVQGFWCLGDLATSAIPALVEIYTNPPSLVSREAADSALKAVVTASAGVELYWVPLQERAEWYNDAGQVKTELGAEYDAILAFSEAIRLEPTNATIYLNRSTTKMRIQDYAGALTDLAKTIDLSRSNQYAFYLTGLCKFALKDFTNAEADFTTAIELSTNDFNAYNYRGLTRANLRRVDDALADFNQAAELHPGDATVYRNRAMIECLQKEYELALEDISRSIELDGSDPFAYLCRGQIKNSLKDHPAAVRDFDKSIGLSPSNAAGYASRGAARMLMDDYTNASADLEKALQIDSGNVIAYLARGWLQAKRGGADDAALADFKRAVELGPQAAETHAVLGVFQYKLAQWGPALENSRKALALDALGAMSDARFYIWLIRAQTGEEAEATRELESFLQSPRAAGKDEWQTSIAQFLAGSLTESNFLRQATTTAKRPSAIRGQVCESLYYAGMKRRIAGDKQDAMALFQQCVDTKEVNSFGYMNAGTELRALTGK